METNNTVVVGDTRKLLSIGRAWLNTRDAGDATKPALTIKIDQNLGINLTLAPNAQVLLFTNPKREGINPNTNEAYQDPDYRVAVSLPAEIADAEIARQQAVAAAAKATPAPATA
jgi:hypothetical protein